MDDKAKAAIAVGSKVKLRDGREGNVTEISENTITVVAGDGSTITAPSSEVEAADPPAEGGEGAGEAA